MKLYNLTRSSVIENGSAYTTYKGFEIFISMHRMGYKFIIGVLLEDKSDACHWVCDYQLSSTISELKAEVKEIINTLKLSPLEYIKTHQAVDISNHFNSESERKDISDIVLERIADKLDVALSLPKGIALSNLRYLYEGAYNCDANYQINTEHTYDFLHENINEYLAENSNTLTVEKAKIQAVICQFISILPHEKIFAHYG